MQEKGLRKSRNILYFYLMAVALLGGVYGLFSCNSHKTPFPFAKKVKNQIYDVVEQPPTFAHGNIMAWLSQNIHYPPVAEENNIQGRVVVTFVVEQDGSISNVKVSKGVDPSLDKEATRVVKSMPKWNPGKQNGQVVRVRYNLPVTFKLQ